MGQSSVLLDDQLSISISILISDFNHDYLFVAFLFKIQSFEIRDSKFSVRNK